MDCAVTDRRADERLPNFGGRIARATLRPGCPVMVVDVSPGGVLIEAGRPLRPGARVHLHIATPERGFTLPALVLRCSVWSIGQGAGEGVLYRGALQFERRWEGWRSSETGKA
jgi:hypothetical protein